MSVIESLPENWQNSDVSAEIPSCFSPTYQALWSECVNHVKSFSDVGSYRERWDETISLFLDQCRADGSDPFVQSGESLNDALTYDLTTQFRDFVKKMHSFRFREKVHAKVTDVQCVLLEQGTSVVITYDMSYDDVDFLNFLQQNGWFYQGDALMFTAPATETVALRKKGGKHQLSVTMTSERRPFLFDSYLASESEERNFVLMMMQNILNTSTPL